MTEAANLNTPLGVEVEVVELSPGEWLTEGVDHGSEGEVYRAIFSACKAEERARAYAKMLAAAPALTAPAEGARSFSGSLALALEDLSSAAEVVRRMLRNSSDHQSRAFDEAGIPFVAAINRAKLVLKDYDRGRSAPEASPQAVTNPLSGAFTTVESVGSLTPELREATIHMRFQGPEAAKRAHAALSYLERLHEAALYTHPQPGVGGDGVREAARALLTACVKDFGDPDDFTGDDGAVASGTDGDCAVTFKHLRDLAAALTATQPDRGVDAFAVTRAEGDEIVRRAVDGFADDLASIRAKPADGGLREALKHYACSCEPGHCAMSDDDSGEPVDETLCGRIAAAALAAGESA